MIKEKDFAAPKTADQIQENIYVKETKKYYHGSIDINARENIKKNRYTEKRLLENTEQDRKEDRTNEIENIVTYHVGTQISSPQPHNQHATNAMERRFREKL